MQPHEYSCPLCDSPLILRHGRRGQFWGCSAYPLCHVALDMSTDGRPAPLPDTGVKCELCGATTVIRQGPRGRFLACSTYPRCHWTKVLLSGS
jgi:ssDNA-binding Zn-finger/Zn-ribbon topoisomerase 1